MLILPPVDRLIRNLTVVAVAALFLLSCRSEADGAARRAAEFDVVNEGSTSGVTSTIGGGAPVNPATLTSTNVDTTTAFAVLNDPNIGIGTNPPTLGNQLPPVSGSSPSPTYRRAPAPGSPTSPPSIRIERQAPPSTPPAEPPPPATPPPAEPPQPSETPEPPPTDTANEQPKPPQENPPKEEPEQPAPAPPPPGSDGDSNDDGGGDAPMSSPSGSR